VYSYISAASSGKVGGAPKIISNDADAFLPNMAANGATPVDTQMEVRMANKAWGR
jgi:hypothetical protein